MGNVFFLWPMDLYGRPRGRLCSLVSAAAIVSPKSYQAVCCSPWNQRAAHGEFLYRHYR